MRNKNHVQMFLKNQFLQLLFPLRCPVCDDIVTPYGRKICVDCEKKLRLLTPPWCMKCGKKLYEETSFCIDCIKKPHKFVRGRALYEYGSVAASIYRFKYGKRQEYADFFGEQMAKYLEPFVREVQPDGLLPIPLHRRRKNKRGYNQAQLLAESLGRQLNIPVYSEMVYRVKNTAPLKLQNPVERQNNLKRAFNIAQNDVKLNTIIIIDDIYTTGSTIDAVAKVCREAGIANVYFLTVSIGYGL